MKKKKVIYILSSSYSGSHFLSLMLGSNSKTKHVGELRKLCKRQNDLQEGRELVYDGDAIFEGIGPDTADSVYDIVFSRLDPSIEGIVDASKSHNKWANRFLHDETYDKYYIHLIRDPRAMLRRWKLTAHFRKNLRMKRRLKSYNHEWARQLRFARQNTTLTYRWIMENRQIDGFLTSNHLNHRLVTYHDAAKNPEEVVGSLMDWLEIPFEPEQLEYWKFHHVGTQKKAYSEVSSREQCAIDLRWQQDLEDEEKRFVLEHPEVLKLVDDFGLEIVEDGLRRKDSEAGGRTEPIPPSHPLKINDDY